MRVWYCNTGYLEHKSIAISVIVFLTFVGYFNSLKNEFVWDDWNFIAENKLIRNLKNAPRFFYDSKSVSVKGSNLIYHPLVTVSYALDYKFWRLNPAGYRFTNLLLHIINGILVYFLLCKIFQNKILSFSISALFCIHPLKTESVTFISGRTDLLATLFLLTGFLFYINQKVLFSLISFVLSLLSKEIGVTLFPIIILYDYFFAAPGKVAKEKIKNLRYRWNIYLPYFIVTSAYLGIRHAVLGGLFTNEDFSREALFTFYTMSAVFTKYLQLFILPIFQSPLYEFPLFKTFFNYQTLMGFLFLILFILIALQLLKNSRETAFGSFFYLITLLPTANIIPIWTWMAERYLYLPSIGFFIFVCFGLQHFMKNKIVILISCVLFVSFCMFRTIKRNTDWKNEIALWKATYEVSPLVPRVITNLGIAYFHNEQISLAQEKFKEAIRIDRSYAHAWQGLGECYQKEKRYEEAVSCYKKVIELKSEKFLALARIRLSEIYKTMGKTEIAIENLQEAIKFESSKEELFIALGDIFFASNKLTEAADYFEKAKKINPLNSIAYFNLGNVYKRQNKYSQAIVYYQEAVQLDSQNAESFHNLGTSYLKRGEIEKAIAMLEKAIQIKPDSALSYNSMGNALALSGKIFEATRSYEKSIQLDENLAEPYLNLATLYEKRKDHQTALYYYRKGMLLLEHQKKIEKSRADLTISGIR